MEQASKQVRSHPITSSVRSSRQQAQGNGHRHHKFIQKNAIRTNASEATQLITETHPSFSDLSLSTPSSPLTWDT